MRLDGKTLLVTGATGIAAASATLAAQRGAAVYIMSLREEECRALAESIRSDGGRCDYSACDLTVAPCVDEAMARAIAAFGRVDCAWNVAGISGRRFGDGPLDECSDEGWDATITNNLRSMFLTNRAVLRHMLAREAAPGAQRGAILNMGSVSAFSPSPKHFAAHAYAASKAAVAGLTVAMAAYYGPRGIRVNCLAPGLVRTPMSRRAQESAEIRAYMSVKQPLAHDGMLTPEQIAETALFLLSDAASGITGQVVNIDAGWSVSGL